MVSFMINVASLADESLMFAMNFRWYHNTSNEKWLLAGRVFTVFI